MSLFSRLFGGGGGDAAPSEAEPVVHDGYRIYPDPLKEGSRYRVGARIEKEIDGEVKTHRLIRADTLESLEAATEVSINKAKITIDQLGDSIFS